MGKFIQCYLNELVEVLHARLMAMSKVGWTEICSRSELNLWTNEWQNYAWQLQYVPIASNYYGSSGILLAVF